MAQTRRLVYSRDEAQAAADRRTSSLAGLALTLFLVVASLYVLHQLASKAVLEDCLLAKRATCDVIISRAR